MQIETNKTEVATVEKNLTFSQMMDNVGVYDVYEYGTLNDRWNLVVTRPIGMAAPFGLLVVYTDGIYAGNSEDIPLDGWKSDKYSYKLSKAEINIKVRN